MTLARAQSGHCPFKVGRGTHLVKNYQSQSRANKTQFKKTSPELKMLGPLCNSYIL